jgi:hypothetical protein
MINFMYALVEKDSVLGKVELDILAKSANVPR